MKEPFYLVPDNDVMYYIQNKNGYSTDEYKYMYLVIEVRQQPILLQDGDPPHEAEDNDILPHETRQHH